VQLFAFTLSADSIPIYLIPGQGSDSTIFEKLTFPEGYEITHIEYVTPEHNETMQAYAIRLAQQITEKECILIGVSLGGMLATEMTNILSPLKTIIISSAKGKNDLPRRYTFQQKIPIYRLVSPRMNKLGAKILQPIVEPDRPIRNVDYDYKVENGSHMMTLTRAEEISSILAEILDY